MVKYKSASGQIQNNCVNGAMLITINRVITEETSSVKQTFQENFWISFKNQAVLSKYCCEQILFKKPKTISSNLASFYPTLNRFSLAEAHKIECLNFFTKT